MRALVVVLAVVLIGACRSQASAEPGVAAVASPGDGTEATSHSTLGGKPPTEAVALLPLGPSVIVGADLAQLVASPAWTQLEAEYGNRPESSLQHITECGLGSDTWRHALVGVVLGRDDRGAVIVEAEGAGTTAILDCLAVVLGPFDLSDSGRRLSNESGGGFVLDDDSVAFAQPDLMPGLEQRLAGKGSGLDEAVTKVVARIAPGKALWVAGVTDPPVYRAVFELVGAAFEDFSLWVDLRDGTLRVSLTVADAAKVRGDFEARWSALDVEAKNFASAAFANSVTFSAAGRLVHIDAKVSAADLGPLAMLLAEPVISYFSPRDFSNARRAD